MSTAGKDEIGMMLIQTLKREVLKRNLRAIRNASTVPRAALFGWFLLSLWLPPLCAQVPPNGLIQLQVQQPTVDISSPATAMAGFDPPTVRVGEKSFYRVVVDAAEASIQWPETNPAPSELRLHRAAQGQLVNYLGVKFRPFTSFVYEACPTASGQWVVPAFSVEVNGQAVRVPPATLDVDNSASGPPARQLVLDVSTTNLFLGQPFHARALLLASPANEIEAIREGQFIGNGFMTDQTTLQQAINNVVQDGRNVPAYIFEATLTPIMAGTLKLSAQGFTAGREFSGPISINGRVIIPGGPPHYELLVSDPVELHVRPLPDAGRLQGFNGTIGNFVRGRPHLSTNRLYVGEAVRLTVAVHGEGDLSRLVAPTPPLAKDWEIVPDKSGFDFTLIPLTDEVRETPAIPFVSFNPTTGKYEDLTIPPLPVTVSGESLPTELPPAEGGTGAGPPLELGGLAPTPGKAAASLQPPQLRGWVVGLQFVPLLGFLGLWRWDCRRRFLAAHPDIVRRRQARRALRREKRRLHRADASGDRAAFVHHAANAMRIAAAPHYAAHPQALVCGEVLERLGEVEKNGAAGETVRRVFSAADAQFAATPQKQADSPVLESEVNAVLVKLEEQL